MATRLWDRGESLDQRIERFTIGRDPELDLRLIAGDCLASAAHASMLTKIGVLKQDELTKLIVELKAIVQEVRAGDLYSNIQGNGKSGHIRGRTIRPRVN